MTSFMAADRRGIGRQHGLEQSGFWRKVIEHPVMTRLADQAMDRSLRAAAESPVMLVHSLWDQ